MHQIHSRYFQIWGIDEYWQIPCMKVSSHNYLSIYARTAENVDKYLVFAFSENWHMCDSTFTCNNFMGSCARQTTYSMYHLPQHEYCLSILYIIYFIYYIYKITRSKICDWLKLTRKFCEWLERSADNFVHYFFQNINFNVS